MRKSIALLFLMTMCNIVAIAQKDLIIKRDGSEMQVKIIMVDTRETVYKTDDRKNSEELRINNTDIYMIKYEKRGNVFFSTTGERFQGKGGDKIPKDAIILYLKVGEEVFAYDLGMDMRNVSYKTSDAKNARVLKLQKDLVFMIKYPDGTREILSEFKTSVADKKETVPQKSTVASGEENMMSMNHREPIPAIIKTHKKSNIKALIVEETSDGVKFYREKSSAGPLYQIDRNVIKSIEYTK